MLFKLLRIRKDAREIKENPGSFAGGEAVTVALGFLVVPIIIGLLGIVLFFLLGFTSVIGGPFGFFKILFIISIVVAIGVFKIIKASFRFIRKSTRRVVDSGIKEVKNEL